MGQTTSKIEPFYLPSPFISLHDWVSPLLTGAKSKPKLGIIVGVVGGLIILLLLGGLLYFTCKRRHEGSKREVFVDVAGMHCFLVVELINNSII